MAFVNKIPEGAWGTGRIGLEKSWGAQEENDHRDSLVRFLQTECCFQHMVLCGGDKVTHWLKNISALLHICSSVPVHQIISCFCCSPQMVWHDSEQMSNSNQLLQEHCYSQSCSLHTCILLFLLLFPCSFGVLWDSAFSPYWLLQCFDKQCLSINNFYQKGFILQK